MPSQVRSADAVTQVIDHVKGTEVVQTMVDIGASKAGLSIGNIFVRGMYGGSLLAFATSISFLFDVQLGGTILIAGALLFPVGFVIINLLGVDLITGYFALTPLATIHRRLTLPGMIRAWIAVWAGNLAGSLVY
ncbi:MAG: formate/nitrite transporter family protein, partial [Candidatus Eremiobacteraeota bacterium]|nr:formate/nitrite transporter family protein [Candidatus Eremiobacteraeota bacterium]